MIDGSATDDREPTMAESLKVVISGSVRTITAIIAKLMEMMIVLCAGLVVSEAGIVPAGIVPAGIVPAFHWIPLERDAPTAGVIRRRMDGISRMDAIVRLVVN